MHQDRVAAVAAAAAAAAATAALSYPLKIFRGGGWSRTGSRPRRQGASVTSASEGGVRGDKTETVGATELHGADGTGTS